MGKIILRLDRVMADRKISLKELSEKVGVSNVNLSKIKTGKISAIRFSTLEAICEALYCQPGDILEYDPSQTSDQDNTIKKVPKMVKIYNAVNIIEAEEIVALLKENGIPAYHQNASGGATTHSMSGFGLYGVDIFVDEADAEKAKRIAGR